MDFFETDYFDLPVGTYDETVLAYARRFVDDPFKAPEQKQQAADYLRRMLRD